MVSKNIKNSPLIARILRLPIGLEFMHPQVSQRSWLDIRISHCHYTRWPTILTGYSALSWQDFQELHSKNGTTGCYRCGLMEDGQSSVQQNKKNMHWGQFFQFKSGISQKPIISIPSNGRKFNFNSRVVSMDLSDTRKLPKISSHPQCIKNIFWKYVHICSTWPFNGYLLLLHILWRDGSIPPPKSPVDSRGWLCSFKRPWFSKERSESKICVFPKK